MTSKGRFAAVLNHQNPDRIPINYMAKTDIDKKLKSHYGLTSEKDLLETLGCDFYFLSARDISQNETFVPIYRGPALHYSDHERTCPFGIRWHRNVRRSKFGADEAIEGPLEKASSPQDILDHPWPKAEWFDMADLIAECEEYSNKVIWGMHLTGPTTICCGGSERDIR